MSTARPFVLTKADEYIESEKQHYEKEVRAACTLLRPCASGAAYCPTLSAVRSLSHR